MSWLSSFLNPGGSYKAAQDEMGKYYDEAQRNLKPYSQQGQDQYATLSDLISSLTDPEALQGKWAEGYEESPAAKNLESMAMEHGLNAASSMGLMGSNTALDALQSGTTKIAMEDRQKYLDDLMQKYLSGAGLAQGIYGAGASSASQMGQNAMKMGEDSAGLKFNQMNSGGNLLGNILGSSGKFGLDYLTGGMGSGSYGRGAWSPFGGQ